MATLGFPTSRAARLVLPGMMAVFGAIAIECGGDVQSGGASTAPSLDGRFADSHIESEAGDSSEDFDAVHQDSGGMEADVLSGAEAGAEEDADAADVVSAADTSDAPENADVCAATPPCVPTLCLGMTLECGDCVDNDGDGQLDMAQPECAGPCDNSEATFGAPIPGDDPAPCNLRCYFHVAPFCSWDLSCDALVPSSACEYAPSPKCQSLQESQSPECLSTCLPAAPNGCDCFGCCELPPHSGQYVFLGSRSDADLFSCTLPDISDPTRCHPCTPVPSCLNPCESCELCVGGQPLEPGCSGIQTCPAGSSRCGLPCDLGCPVGEFCQTGCCVPVP